jgi:hypothetical protein
LEFRPGNVSEFETILLNGSIHDHLFERAFYLMPHHLSGFIKSSKGKLLERIMTYNYFGTLKAFNFPRNHRFYEVFDRKIQQIVTAGIIDHFADDFKNLFNKKQFSHLHLEVVEPMNTEHLKAAFAVWLVSLCFPAAAFIAEWILKFLKVLKLKLKTRNKRRTDRKAKNPTSSIDVNVSAMICAEIH